MKKALGQFMTPAKLAMFVARQLRSSDVVIDLAAGDGALLKAARQRLRDAKFIGFDIDKEIVKKANLVPGLSIRQGNGLIARISSADLREKISIIGNPPFIGNSLDSKGWIKKAFPDLTGKKAVDRAEIQFLARALWLAKKSAGRVIFVMPIGFADGDTYRNIRASLMRNFMLTRCIEVIGAPFQETEARTVILVIDPQETLEYRTEIAEYDCDTCKLTSISKEVLEPGIRLDARYHRAMRKGRNLAPIQLKDLQVSVTRGIFSRKDAAQQNIIALHTSDLGRASSGTINFRSNLTDDELVKHVVARKGDILLSRTGSRVSWTPVILQSGAAPITDHVFRIRAPVEVQDMVVNSFLHPEFVDWLRGISKGVCATVLTKRELLEMPVFAWNSAEQILPRHII